MVHVAPGESSTLPLGVGHVRGLEGAGLPAGQGWVFAPRVQGGGWLRQAGPELGTLKVTFPNRAAPSLKRWHAAELAQPARLTLLDTSGTPWAHLRMNGVKVVTLDALGSDVVATLSVAGASLER